MYALERKKRKLWIKLTSFGVLLVSRVVTSLLKTNVLIVNICFYGFHI